MEKKEYLYMKQWSDLTYVVTYQLGAYYVSLMATKKNGLMLVPFDRKYKTVSGASRFLERLGTGQYQNKPKEFYGTEKFIKEGSYWKGEK